MEFKNSRLRFLIKLLPLFYCFTIFFISVSGLCSTSSFKSTCLGIVRCQSSIKAGLSFQEIERKRYDHNAKNIDMGFIEIQLEEASLRLARRLLSGPGSSPPRCTSKCGKCTPCRPVHVPVPPGTPVTAEYYPEAWRCKCGNKLYMP